MFRFYHLWLKKIDLVSDRATENSTTKTAKIFSIKTECKTNSNSTRGKKCLLIHTIKIGHWKCRCDEKNDWLRGWCTGAVVTQTVNWKGRQPSPAVSTSQLNPPYNRNCIVHTIQQEKREQSSGGPWGIRLARHNIQTRHLPTRKDTKAASGIAECNIKEIDVW